MATAADFYALTEEHKIVCEKVREVRERRLDEAFEGVGIDLIEVSRLARTLRTISGIYDQAARAAASLEVTVGTDCLNPSARQISK
jgi:predicted MarR family transcription regulator